MPPRKKPAQPPKLQKLDAEWKAFIKNAQKIEPHAAPWPDPSGTPLKASKRKVEKAPAKRPARKGAPKKGPARKK